VSWPIVTLNDIAINIVDGPFGSSLKTSDYVDEGVPVLQGKNITGNRFKFFDVRYITEKKAESIKRSTVKVGDHLLVKIGSIGYSAIIDDLYGHDFAIIPANLAKITPNKEVIDSRYLHRYLTSDSAIRYFQKIASKTAQPALSLSKIKALEIPLPLLSEQRRIASILDQADELRQKRQQAIEKLNQLLQATFIDMFGDPVSNPKGWEVGCIGDMLESVKYGSSDKATLEGEIPILRMNNLTYSGEMDLRDLKYITKVQADEKYLVKEGDILFNRTNSKELVGKTAVYVGPEPMAYAGYLVRGRTKENFAPEYISAFLNSPWGKEKLQSMCKSIVGMANINAKEFQSIVLPIPPENEQMHFRARVLAIREKKQLLINQSNVFETLFKSLQNQAFNGTL